MQTKSRKARAGLLLFVTLFSILLLLGSIGHECSVEGCPVCTSIRQMEQLLKLLGTAANTGLCAFLSAVLTAIALFSCRLPRLKHVSLITQNIRMND